ncbi:unnamed protein product, partial [Symbiodinium microadriaticum]
VPTEVPSDVEVDAASGDGVPGPPGPTATPPSPAMASAPAVEAYRYLLDQGFGVLELASLDLDEVPAMAQQLAEELAIPSEDWLADALYCWLQEVQQEAKIHRRVKGYFQDDLTWMTLMPPLSAQGEDRAALLLVGRTRASTLKRYLSYYRQWRLWLAEAKLRYPLGRPADLVDYLLARRDEPCGRSVPEAILKAISWMEK